MENNKKQSLCIGITGGLASGKTTAAKFIENEGYPVIYTDDLAKELMVTNDKIIRKIKRAFGDDIYLSNGTLNAALLAEKVFSGTEESRKNLQRLNVIVHPSVIDGMMKRVEEYESQNHALIFVESALIYEMGLDEGFDYVICVYANDDIMLKRAAERGFTPEQVQQRLSEQLPAKQKLAWSDFSINNNNSVEELKDATISLLNILKEL